MLKINSTREYEIKIERLIPILWETAGNSREPWLTVSNVDFGYKIVDKYIGLVSCFLGQQVFFFDT